MRPDGALFFASPCQFSFLERPCVPGCSHRAAKETRIHPRLAQVTVEDPLDALLGVDKPHGARSAGRGACPRGPSQRGAGGAWPGACGGLDRPHGSPAAPPSTRSRAAPCTGLSDPPGHAEPGRCHAQRGGGADQGVGGGRRPRLHRRPGEDSGRGGGGARGGRGSGF